MTEGARRGAAGTVRRAYHNGALEYNFGIYETIANMYSTAAVESGTATHTWRIAPDIKARSGINAGTGWVVLEQKTAGQTSWANPTGNATRESLPKLLPLR